MGLEVVCLFRLVAFLVVCEASFFACQERANLYLDYGTENQEEMLSMNLTASQC